MPCTNVSEAAKYFVYLDRVYSELFHHMGENKQREPYGLKVKFQCCRIKGKK